MAVWRVPERCESFLFGLKLFEGHAPILLLGFPVATFPTVFGDPGSSLRQRVAQNVAFLAPGHTSNALHYATSKTRVHPPREGQIVAEGFTAFRQMLLHATGSHERGQLGVQLVALGAEGVDGVLLVVALVVPVLNLIVQRLDMGSYFVVRVTT